MKIIVAGGGWAGCAAALSARKQGADVVLIERTDMLLGTGLVGGIMCNNGRFTAAEEMIGQKGNQLGAFSGSCKLLKESLSKNLRDELNNDGVVVVPLPESKILKGKLSLKACRQYAIQFVRTEMLSKKKRGLKYTFSGSVFFDRMMQKEIYTTDIRDIENRVHTAGMANVFA